MSTLPPHERRQQKTREAILSTALELIVEKGPDGLSLREIARRIDYSPAGLYEYFGSKDEIIQAVCREGDDRLRAYLEAVPADAYSPQEYLLELGEAYLNFARQNPEHYLFAFTYQEMSTTTEKREGIEIPADDTFMIIVRAIQSGIDVGAVKAKPGFQAIEIAYSMWALAHGLAMLEARFSGKMDFDFDQIARQAFEHYVQSFSDG